MKLNKIQIIGTIFSTIMVGGGAAITVFGFILGQIGMIISGIGIIGLSIAALALGLRKKNG